MGGKKKSFPHPTMPGADRRPGPVVITVGDLNPITASLIQGWRDMQNWKWRQRGGGVNGGHDPGCEKHIE